MNSSFKKNKSDFVVVENDNDKKVSFKISEEETITIYDEQLIAKMIDTKFNKTYRNLLYLICQINESDDSTDTDTYLVLDKIEDLKNKLLNKYYKYLNKDVLSKYLKMLILLEEKLSLSKGRGR